MADVVVTVPKNFEYAGYRGLAAWISEGDAAGDAEDPNPSWSGGEWDFYLGGNVPKIDPGERVYVVCEGKLRGYAPLTRIEYYEGHRYSLVRGSRAVAVTINEPIRGFQGFRYRWWKYEDEKPFPDWKTP